MLLCAYFSEQNNKIATQIYVTAIVKNVLMWLMREMICIAGVVLHCLVALSLLIHIVSALGVVFLFVFLRVSFSYGRLAQASVPVSLLSNIWCSSFELDLWFSSGGSSHAFLKRGENNRLLVQEEKIFFGSPLNFEPKNTRHKNQK